MWFDDERYLAVNTRTPRKDLIFHWLAISEVHWIVAEAVARQKVVSLAGWYNEWETINKGDAEGDRYFLHTQLQEHPPLSCSPDAAFLLSVAGYRKVFYVEVDRGTSGIRQVAASKTPGYAELFRRGLHRRHFPEATLDRFSVLCITTDHRRRDALAKAVSKRTDHEPDLWLFIDQTEITPETFLHGRITYNCAGEPGALVKKTAASAPSSAGSNATRKDS